MFSVTKRATWKNWSQSVVAQPQEIVKPKTLQELISIVNQCANSNTSLRVVGAGHSFTPLAATSEILVSLDYLTGIDRVDQEQQLVTLWAGTRLKDIGPMLYEHGFAMENLGDINEQSIAGAISTGTHGTGVNFKSLSNQVAGLTILTASGELLEINRNENDNFFEAARLSLGMLGIIVKVTLKVVPAYSLYAKSYRLTLEQGFHQLKSLKENNRNFEFFWFPFTKTIQVKTLNEIKVHHNERQKQQFFSKFVMENGLFFVLSEMSRNIPNTAKAVSQISALGVPVGESVNISYEQYATPRLVKFNEMEYCVPQAALEDVIYELDELIKREKIEVHFPIECRFVKADSIWLSPSYERNSAYIGIHMYKGMELGDYFDKAEEIFLRYDGRPHWGKMHSLTFNQLQEMYPKFDDFLQVRKQLDPNGLFLNEYLRTLFNV